MVVASGITAVLHIVIVIGGFFRIATGEIAFALLSYHVCDECTFRLEVVAHGFCFVGRASLFKNRCALQLTHGVRSAESIDSFVFHIYLNLSCFQLQVVVCNLSVAIHICFVATDEDKRIGRVYGNNVVYIHFFPSDA